MRIALLFSACSLAIAGLSGCATPFAVVSPASYFEQTQVYQPLRSPQGHWEKKESVHAKDAWITADDGIELHGWYVAHENPSAVVLYAHGNAGNVTTEVDTIRMLHDRHNASVLVFDYRGYGRSGGNPSEEGLVSDARAARRWLAVNAGVEEKDIVLMGHSLGTGVVVRLAAEDGARGLILWSGYSSMTDLAKHHAPMFASSIQTKFDSLSKIKRYHGPLLQVHAEHDKVVPYRFGKKLFEAANQPKRLVTQKGGDHNVQLSESEEKTLDLFLTSLPPFAFVEYVGEAPSMAEASRESL